jgi:hypothetical protein
MQPLPGLAPIENGVQHLQWEARARHASFRMFMMHRLHRSRHGWTHGREIRKGGDE